MKHKFSPLIALVCLILLSGFQIIKTTLHITVRDDLGNTTEGATVQLFETEDDYLNEEHIVAEGISDKRGIVKFKDIKAIAYYVIVRKDDKDNSGGGEKTAELDPKKINKVTIMIQ
jgi:hypothetical protein